MPRPAVVGFHAARASQRRELLNGKLLPYCKSKGYEQLKELNVDTLRIFRKSWKFAATSAVKRLEYLRGFLRFCEESEWIERSPAKGDQATSGYAEAHVAV